ncbi:MAG: hypothetical protein LBG64_00845 [Pseudomonadales bacterium]|jgi:peptidoglycan hydrolase CwlO-like protein|nr:hypothetical protein [Pseudomonadales bacterium]
MKLILLLTLVFSFFLSSGGIILADDDCNRVCANILSEEERAICIDRRIACYQRRIDDNRNRQSTLQNTIADRENRIRLREMEIERTQVNIIRARREIEILDNRIDNLSDSLDQLTLILSIKIDDSFKQLFASSDLEMILGSRNVSEFAQARMADQVVAHHTSILLFQAMNQKLNYNEQRTDREELQQSLEREILRLEQQQRDLENERAELTVLLAQTRNDEQQYQRLLEEARAEAESFRRFAASAGGATCLSASPGGGSDGRFLSQRDPRWCRQLIGRSNLTVGEVGCFIAAVVMVHNYHGSNISIPAFAANNNNFFSNTALMLTPPAPSGFTHRRQNFFNQETIDRELRYGRPVIVHVSINNGWGGHFVVLTSGSNGTYMMHDPWHGADIAFSRFYNVGQITSMRLFTR